MIIWKLAEVMASRQARGKALAEATGLKVDTISRLRRRRSYPKITGATLESLCLALDCQPGDLIEYKADRLPETRGGRRVKQKEEVPDRA
jgi:putative transcriptional regulator